MKLFVAMVIGVVALAPSGAGLLAQGRSQERARPDTSREIPVSARPPAGMCRIWLENVPVAQQPAPTDCASAVRNRPAKGRVVFGDDYAKTRTAKGDTAKPKLPVRGFAPANAVQKKPDTTFRPRRPRP
ncbi:MAG: hypothetical protein WD801_06090 [Gemmatimonadaceae bacterium]